MKDTLLKPETPDQLKAESGSMRRLVRRCQVWNETQGTCYTPETYAHDRERVSDMVMWDLGWEQSESEAKRLLAAIVAQYDDAPDGPLGRGFTNGPFLAAREFLSSPNVQSDSAT